MSVAIQLKNWIQDIRGTTTYHRYGEKERRRNRLLSQFMALATLSGAAYYIFWCIKNANWDAWYLVIPFLLAETGFAILLVLWITMLWNKRHHRPSGVAPKMEHTVDVFIPVVHEPSDTIEKTIIAAKAIRHPKLEVYLLDDGAEDRHKCLAEKHGIHYLRRPSRVNRKAGNLNYALRHSKGDLILALDADQVARPDFLEHTVGYFNFPHVGFVQTSQQFSLPPGDPWGNSDSVFYKAMQTAKDHDNAAISCGSGVIYRRKAVEQIGGFSEWNVVEDLHTSLQLHSNGWHSIFHDNAYTVGTAPSEVLVQVKQRWQWAVDSLRMIFWDNPFRYKGLTFAQRLQYFHFGFNYIVFGLCLPVFFVLPIWALFTGTFVLPPPFYLYAIARGPYLIAQLATNKLITYQQYSFKSFQAQAGLFPTYIDAIFTALCSKTRIPKYTVTSKVNEESPFRSRLWKCLPHLLLSGGALAAIIHGIVSFRGDVWFLGINGFWAFWVICVLNRFILLSLCPRWMVKG